MGTAAAPLLGVSAGASSAVSIMLKVLARCFPEKWSSEEWRKRLERVVPSFRWPRRGWRGEQAEVAEELPDVPCLVEHGDDFDQRYNGLIRSIMLASRI